MALDNVGITTLPCERGRHGACNGDIVIPIASDRHCAICTCSCHRGRLRDDEILELAYPARRRVRTLALVPPA